MLSTRCSKIFPFLSSLYTEVQSNRPRRSHGTRGIPWMVQRTIMTSSIGCHTLPISTHNALKNILPWNRKAQKIDLQFSIPIMVLSGSLNTISSLQIFQKKKALECHYFLQKKEGKTHTQEKTKENNVYQTQSYIVLSTPLHIQEPRIQLTT